MKLLLAILCCLPLIGGQFVAVAACVPEAAPAAPCCDCCGKMQCCATAPVKAPQPLPSNTTRAGVENQILSPAPALVILVGSSAGASIFARTTASLVTANAAPIFARNCTRLI
jgi:hypothetical protein